MRLGGGNRQAWEGEIMSNQDSSGATCIFVAFLLGAVTGAAVALLFAPAAGRETREFLSERAREGREKAVETAKKTRELLAEQRDTISAAVDRGREVYREAREKESV
jgi:gas vesicle protein